MKEVAGGEGAGIRRGSSAEAATAGFDLDRELLSRSGSLGRAGRRHGSGADGLPGPELGFGWPSSWDWKAGRRGARGLEEDTVRRRCSERGDDTWRRGSAPVLKTRKGAAADD